MKTLYGIDDYTTVSDVLQDAVDKKVSLLYDFCILHKRQEPQVRTLLTQCKSENEMTRVLHDVLLGRTTLTQLLKKKGVM